MKHSGKDSHMDKFKEFDHITIHLSNAQGTPVYNSDGTRLGKLCDFFIDYEEVYPSVIALQYKRNGTLFYVLWENVESFSLKKIKLSVDAYSRRSRTFPKTLNQKKSGLLGQSFEGPTVEYPPLGLIVLDKQIVDTHGKKVVRVNDIQFVRTGNDLRVTHAEVGLRSFIRRLSLEKPVDYILKNISPQSRYLTNDSAINWKFVHAIPNRNIQKSVRLNLTNEDLKELHPADIADILEDLDGHGREMIFSTLDPELAADTLSEIDDEDLQVSLLQNENPEKVAEIIENMDTADAADLLNELDEAKADAIISNIEDHETQEEIQELLEFDEDSAGGLMTSSYFDISPHLKKSELLQLIQDKHGEVASFYDFYVIDENHKLIGSLNLQEMLIVKEDLKVSEMMNDSDIHFAKADWHWKEAAEYMNKYNLVTVPVVGNDGELLGMISVDDILDRLLS